NLKSGCTVVSALIREKTVYLSWLGDSQAVLVKEGKPVIVTDPHKPERMDEKKRIEDVGGEITSHTGVPRVNGILAVTRALGDPDHKRYISSEPEITTIELDGTEDFLILACDGLWDGMSPEDVTSALYYNLSGSALDEPLDAVAGKLVHQSKLQGSEDNITAAVVFLRDIKAIKDFATKLLSQTSSKLNLFEMNGGEKECISEEVLNAPCIKPTVLELSSASAKKLKNTANVLSSAGITDSSYACPYSENAIEGMSFQKTSSDAIFIPYSKVPPHLAPEATALSELPTPPIDDVLASQQFEKLSSGDFYQDFNSFSSESNPNAENINSEASESNTNILLHSTETLDTSSIDVLDSYKPPEKKDVSITEEVNHKTNDITPEEAVDIASCVVSETIETAVKQISSETPNLSTSHKLNPYAEPFVMKSFIPDSDQFQIEETPIIASDDSQSQCEIQNETKNEVTVTEKISDSSNIDISVDKTVLHDSSLMTCDLNSPTVNLEIKNEDFATSVINTSPKIPFNPSLPNFEDIGSNHIIDQIAGEPFIKTDSSKPVLEGKVDNAMDHLSDFSNSVSGEPLEVDSLISAPSAQANNSTFLSDSFKENASIDSTVKNPFNGANSDYNAVCPPSGDSVENPVDRPHEVNESNSNIVHVPKIEAEIHTNALSSFLNNEIVSNSKTFDNVGDGSLIIDNSLPKNTTEVENSTLSKIDIATSQIKSELKNDTLPDQASNAAKILNDILASPKNAAEIETSALSDQINDASLILNNISAIPQAITSTELTTTAVVAAAVLSVEECSTETLTVDLQALPDGIPEAEGVTEDVDSDSEKDGGWSYMKGNSLGTGKHKSKDLATKSVKLANKTDATIKAKKDITKPPTDNKSKLKSLTSVDKSKKLLPEKKILDVKEKNKLRNVSSTLPKATVDKPMKLTSTVTKVKKEITVSSVNRVATAASSKNILGATARNTSTLSKSASHSTAETSQTLSSKPIGSTVTGTTRPKSALTTGGTKTTARPPNSVAPVLKGPSTNQSNKSNLASTVRSNTLNRPVGSSVPNKTLTRPPLSTKPAPAESKTKPLTSTMKKIMPSTLKKSDGKETKDIVNKQISARKNVLNKTDALKNASVPARNAMTLNNKTVPIKSRSVPVKSDLSKKDVPKPSASKFPVKTGTVSRLSQNAASGKVKKTLPVEEKPNEKKTDSTVKNEQSITEVTPVCDEEKFILEVNDKEVIVKEQEDVLVNSDSKLDCESNVVTENKPLEEMPITS
ncbi:hypothetical protein TNCT_636681, partial [Trichonephila clavata]